MVNMEIALGITAFVISVVALVSSLYTAWLTRTSTRPLLVIGSSPVEDLPSSIPILNKKKLYVVFKNIGVNPAEDVVINIETILPNKGKTSESTGFSNPIEKEGAFTSCLNLAYDQVDIGKSVLIVCKLLYTDSFFQKKWALRKNIYHQTLYLKYKLGDKKGVHATLEDIKEITSS
jgi:hypothetical protein